MSTALATVNQNSMTVANDAELSREQVDLLKRTICYGASDAEFELFVGFCRRMQLDPFSKQVHFVPRRMKDPRTGAWVERREPMISIDGFRVIAERSGRYEGQTAPQWCGKDGKWVDVWLAEEPPAAARVGIFKAGFREPIYQPASYLSYVQETKDGAATATWKKMPDVMLSKCAEALALRKAFPNDLSGVYAPEEMAQSHRGADFIDVVAEAAERPALPEPHPAVVMAQATFEGSTVATPLATFEEVSARLNAVPGYVGDEAKEKRKQWLAGVLGYKQVPRQLYQAYTKADDATKVHVAAELQKLEEAAKDDDVPAFPSPGREPGEEG